MGCEVDPIIKSYEKGWNADLVGVLPTITPGLYSGLSPTDDGDFVVLRETLQIDFTSDLAVIKVNPNADVTGAFGPLNNGQNIDIRQSSNTPSLLKVHGQSVLNPNLQSIVSFNEKSGIESMTIDLTDELVNLVPTRNFLSNTHFYLSGLNLNSNGYSILRFQHNGNVDYTLALLALPVDYIEGEGDILFVLTNNEEVYSLNSFNENGELDWSVPLNGDNGIISDLESARNIFVSPSNTTTILGSDEEGDLLIAFIDPRGDLIFQRTYPGFLLSQLRDYKVTRDGASMMILTGLTEGEDPSFTVFKLNHRAVNVWRADYVLNEPFGNVEFVELKNRDIVVLTTAGDLFYINSD